MMMGVFFVEKGLLFFFFLIFYWSKYELICCNFAKVLIILSIS